MPLFPSKIHRQLYVTGLSLLGASLPLSEFTLSVAIIAIGVNWLAEGNFKMKWVIIRTRRSLWMNTAIYFIFLAGMIYSADQSYGWNDLRIKLPLLVLPLIMGSSEPLSYGEWKIVSLTYLMGVFIATLAGIASVAGLFEFGHGTASVFISHVRFALLINIAIMLCTFFLWNALSHKWQISTPGYLFLILWFVFYLFVLKSITGLVILFITLLILLIYGSIKFNSLIPKLFFIVSLITIILVSFSFIAHSIGRYYQVNPIDAGRLEAFTRHGNPYVHDPVSRQVENGHYVWIYVCEPEMRESWNKISTFPYDGKDLKQQWIRFTLIRYLTSRGLRKDADGVMTLTANDIRAIEEGNTNYLFLDKLSLYPKVYEILWQIDIYRQRGNPSGHSLTQRIEYLVTAFRIIDQHPWFGVGTGDVKDAFDQQYEKQKSLLDPAWRLRAHNQYVTFMLTFGIIGFFFLTAFFGYMLFSERTKIDLLTGAILMVILLSMLTEDTLETHTGVSFVAFFLSILLLARTEQGPSSQKNTHEIEA
jgi:hypothetical protein